MSEPINNSPENQPSQSGPPPVMPPPPPKAECRSGVLDSLCSAMHEGANQARSAAEQAAPKVKAAVADAVYWFGFGVSYASVFSTVVLKELAPEVLKTGCREGAEAGRKAGAEFLTDLKQRKTAAPEAGPSAETGGPSPEPQRF